MMALGCFFGIWLVLREGMREGFSPDTLFDMLFLQILVSLFGSRAMFVIEYYVRFGILPGLLETGGGGFTFYGAVLISLLSNYLFLRYMQLPFWQIMDIVGMGMIGGTIFGRFGCFLTGCCYGVPCSWPWGVTFPNLPGFLGPVHPTQLYEAFIGMGILTFLQWFKDRRKTYGHGFLAFILLYAPLRFFLEFFRGDNPVIWAGMTFSQVISAALFFFSLLLWRILAGRPDLLVPEKNCSPESSPKPS
jgi:phosphatidylglycerol:prolipoprotein diacylglycerol transferase